MRISRGLRYLAPNLLTTANLCFGMLSILASFEGRYIDAGWLIIYAVLTDRMDGFVARLVRGASELGVQLDSFADLLNFGIAPAVLVYSSLVGQPGLPFVAGTHRILLMLACGAWILSAVFRLARYNITTGEVATYRKKIFFGVPTTLVGGLLVAWYLALAKYAPPGSPMATEPFGGPRLFGDFATPAAVWHYFPLAMAVGAFLMASSLRMPKLGLANSKAANAFIFTNVALGYGFGFARFFPEYIIWPPTMWLVVFLAWGALSPAARAMKPPPLFPEVDPPRGQEPIRPECDLLPEGEDSALDELPATE